MISVVKQWVKAGLTGAADRLGGHRRDQAAPRLWILMYHRILPADDARYALEEPGMLVQPDHFALHLREIKRHFDVVRLADWVDALEKGERLPKRACAITFDDGWLDNYEYALPLLKAEQTPATLFVVAGKIGTDFHFWPNIVALLLRGGFSQAMARHALLGSAITDRNGSDDYSPDDISAAIQRLKRYTDQEIHAALDDLAWRNLLAPHGMPPALCDWQQIHEMVSSGWVDIGSHTCTHRRLTEDSSAEELHYEIADSRVLIHKHLGITPELFCFPNGDYSPAALALVKQHYKAAVTTRSGINNVNHLYIHELTRLGVHDDISHTRRLFSARLSGWV